MLSDLQKRFLAFLIGCIGVRSLMVILVKRISKKYLPYLGLLALGPILGWINIIFLIQEQEDQKHLVLKFGGDQFVQFI